MGLSKKFKLYQMDQPFLLPPDIKDWLNKDHLAYFIYDVVNEINLKDIYRKYPRRKGGQPPFHPQMMVTLLVYAYCVGKPSSRKIEKATHESIPFRVISADQHPDHDTIAEFRKRHLKELSGLFVEVLRLCQKAGMVKLGQVALDGTKIKANASKHKAMSYGRMEKAVSELENEVKDLMEKARLTDEKEDALYGKGKRGDELPEDLQYKETRLKKIKEAMAALEQEARERADREQKEYEKNRSVSEKEKTKKKRRLPWPPSDKVKPKAQRNFTDPDSRIMKDGATKSFVQAYNAQAAVDEENQVIVACHITQSANDKEQLNTGLEKITQNTGESADKILADAGYWSEENATDNEDTDLYIAPCKEKRTKEEKPPRGRIPKGATVKERMIRKLSTIKGRMIYSRRKQIVEPVFGQIKEVRGFRQFSFRGKENVGREWTLICLTHNLLKLFRYNLLPQPSP